MDDEGRLVGLAAMRDRREERRVGLDEQPVLGKVAGDLAQLVRPS